MKLFLKISAGILSGIVLVACLMFAIPVTRNFILNTFAPYSQAYQNQKDTIDDLNEANLKNSLLLAETRTSLMNAEFKAISYQNEVSVLQNNLLTSQNNLALVLSQKSEMQKNLEETNKTLLTMSTQLSDLRNQYRTLNTELDTLMDSQDDNSTRINELNTQITSVTQDISSLENIVSGLTVASETYETRIAEYEATITENNSKIQQYENEIISLKSQIAELKETIKSLESVNATLNGDDSYKKLFQDIVGGTVTELKASDLEGLTEIRSYAFYNCKTLRKVELPESIETIGAYAFYGCSNLESFTFTQSLKRIGQNAFENCTSLNEIDLSNIEYVGGFAFSSSSVEIAHLPSTLSSWGGCVFQNSSIREIYVAEGVTKIPFGLLHGCGRIENVYLPSTLESIDTFGISNYSNNVNVFFAGTQEQFNKITYVASDNTSFANANVVCNYQY